MALNGKEPEVWTGDRPHLESDTFFSPSEVWHRIQTGQWGKASCKEIPSSSYLVLNAVRERRETSFSNHTAGKKREGTICLAPWYADSKVNMNVPGLYVHRLNRHRAQLYVQQAELGKKNHVFLHNSTRKHLLINLGYLMPYFCATEQWEVSWWRVCYDSLIPELCWSRHISYNLFDESSKIEVVLGENYEWYTTIPYYSLFFFHHFNDFF